MLPGMYLTLDFLIVAYKLTIAVKQSPGTDNVEPSGSASQTKEILLDVCDWLASNSSKGKSQ